jgi:hypothetical protein
MVDTCSNRVRSGALSGRDPGTSCLATIVLFLRDKMHSAAEAFGFLQSHSVCLQKVQCIFELLLSE